MARHEVTVRFSEIKSMLLPHQVSGVEWMLERELDENYANMRSGILADDMGLGKTYQTAALVKANECSTLIITTKSTLGQWRDALQKIVGRNVSAIFNSLVANELSPVDSPKNIFITTYETVVSQVELIKKTGGRRRSTVDATRNLILRRYGRIVLDEAHLIRNRSTERFKAIMWLEANYRWALTGTPINNHINDLESLSEWIGVRLTGNPVLQKRYIMRRTMEHIHFDNDGHARVPDIKTRIVIIRFSPQEKSLYDHLEADLTEQCCGGPAVTGSDRERAISYATNIALHGREKSCRAMEGILRLKQVCVHPLLFRDSLRKKMMRSSIQSIQSVDDQASQRRDFALRLASDIQCSSKIEYIANSIISHCVADGDIKAVVFCEWLHEMDLIEESLQRNQARRNQYISGSSDQRQEIEKEENGSSPICLRFNGGLSIMERDDVITRFSSSDRSSISSRVMLVQIRAGGTGINLQAASKVYVTSPNWNPCNELQALSRAYRQGQTRQVECERVVLGGSIEEKCIELQQKKLYQLDAILNTATCIQDKDDADAKDAPVGKGKQRELTETDLLLKRMGFESFKKKRIDSTA